MQRWSRVKRGIITCFHHSLLARIPSVYVTSCGCEEKESVGKMFGGFSRRVDRGHGKLAIILSAKKTNNFQNE